MNNPLNKFDPAGFLLRALNGGQGLGDALKQIESQGVQYSQAVKMIRGKNAQELQTYAQNLAKEYGVDLSTLLNQFGVKR